MHHFFDLISNLSRKSRRELRESTPALLDIWTSPAHFYMYTEKCSNPRLGISLERRESFNTIVKVFFERIFYWDLFVLRWFPFNQQKIWKLKFLTKFSYFNEQAKATKLLGDFLPNWQISESNILRNLDHKIQWSELESQHLSAYNLKLAQPLCLQRESLSRDPSGE